MIGRILVSLTAFAFAGSALSFWFLQCAGLPCRC